MIKDVQPKMIWKRMHSFLKQHVIYFSLIFIALNPMGDGDDLGSNAYARTRDSEKSPYRDEAAADKIQDYYKLGKMYLLQGDFTSSYNAFLKGERLDGVDGFQSGHFLDPAQAFDDSAVMGNSDVVEKDTLDNYLSGLIDLYVQRAKALIQEKTDLEEARNELNKVFIIDSTNQRARELTRLLSDAEDQKDQSDNGRMRKDVPTTDSAASRRFERTKKDREVIVQPIRPQRRVTSSFKSAGTNEQQGNEKNVTTDVIESALIQAEHQMSATILKTPAHENAELRLKEQYDLAKEYFQRQDLFRAVTEFKKVVALNPDHLYAEYAREYIRRGMQKIKDQEERDLQTLLPQTDLKVSERHAMDREEESSAVSMDTGTVLSQGQEPCFDNAEKIKVVNAHESDAGLVKDNSADLNDGNTVRIHAEEKAKERDAARDAWRMGQKLRLEKRYQTWKLFNQKVAKREMQAKVNETLLHIRKSISLKDYFGADRQLQILFLLVPEHPEGKILQKTIQKEIEELTHLLKKNPEPLEVDDFLKEEDLDIDDGVPHVPTSASGGKEVRRPEKKPITNSSKRTQPASTKVAGGRTMEAQMFAGISQYKPFTVLTPREKTDDIPVRNVPAEVTGREVVIKKITPVENKVLNSDELQERSQIKMQEHLRKGAPRQTQGQKAKNDDVTEATAEKDQESTDLIDQWVYQWKRKESLPADMRLEEYLNRGKRHFRQKNYPLALVSFNKVMSLDREKKYIEETRELIAQTKKHLYD